MAENRRYVGYIRTKSNRKYADGKYERLKEFGCSEIFLQKTQEQQLFTLTNILTSLNAGDVLVVDQLVDFGLSIHDFAKWLPQVSERQIHLVALKEGIDTRQTEGRYFFQWIRRFSNMEKELVSERTIDGLVKARQAGNIGGRPQIKKEIIEKIRFLFFQKKETVHSIARKCQVSMGTCYKYIHLNESEYKQLLKKLEQT